MAPKSTTEKLQKSIDELEKMVLENDGGKILLNKKSSFVYQLLVETLPYSTMLINKDKTILFANKIARDAGAVIGGICWRDFGHGAYLSDEDKACISQNKKAESAVHCTYCLANVALKAFKPAIAPEIKAFGKFWECQWIPVTEDIYLHSTFDITKQKKAKEEFKGNEARLSAALQTLEKKENKRTAELVDMNSTLKVLLKKRVEDKRNIEEQIFSNYRRLILPIIDKLRNCRSEETQQDLIDVLESEIKNIISPFSKKLSDPMVNLTPKEIEVAGLIKFGKSNKEIAEILNSSMHTISRHREHIRVKLDLTNKKVNLRSFLLAL